MRRNLFLSLSACCIAGALAVAEEQASVFSGPQAGERLAPFKVSGVFGEQAGKPLDFVTSNEGKPQVLIFVHELTRPSIAVTRAVMKYAASRHDDGLINALVFLGDDATEVEERLKRARHALPEDTLIGISADGQEGPGSYGLNRNVTLTVLVANEGRVTANFPIVQPTPAVDVPKIVGEITKVIGGETPSLADLGIRRYQANDPAPRRSARGGAQDLPPRLQAKLRQLIRNTTTPDDVKRVSAEIEEATKDDAKSRRIIGAIAGRVQNAPYFANVTPEAQDVIRGWAKRFSLKPDATADEESGSGEQDN